MSTKPGTELPKVKLTACDPGDYSDYDGDCILILDEADDFKRVAVVLGSDEQAIFFAQKLVDACNNYAALEAKLERMEKALGWRDTDTLPTEDDAFVLGCDYHLFNPFVAHRFEGEWWYEGRRVDLICWMPCPARYTPQDLRRFNEAKSALTASTTENGGSK